MAATHASRIAYALTMALLYAGSVAAQSPALAPSDRVVYEAVFYGPFSPRTALDVINQTPGFVLQEGDERGQRRGFSGAVGNVLIDGERLSAKSQSVIDVLRRLPAAEVLRVELLRGSAVAGDASGAAVLANVVRTRTSGSGTWEAGAEVTNQHEPAPAGRFGWSGRNESTQFSVGGNVYTHDHNSPGRRTVNDGQGALIARRYDSTPHENEDYSLNGQVSHPLGEGTLTVTGQYASSRYRNDATQLTTTPDGTQLENEHNPQRERVDTGEAGVTYQRALSVWDMTLVALATRKQLDVDVSSAHFNAANEQDSVFEQQVDQASGESIVRATFARALTDGRLEAGGEFAINTLNGELDLTLDVGAGPAPVAIPNANLRVKENRSEAFVSHVWNMSERWSLDSRLAAETSRLSFTGDTEQSVSLTYVKPRVQLTRKFGAHQLQLRAFRDVGQLVFTDFVSTAALADDLIDGGNPDLKPQSEWALELDSDWRFGGDTALRVRLFHHWLDDVVDSIPVGPPGNQFDAPGNIGEGTLTGTEISLQLPLRAVLPGGTFNLSGTWQDSRVRDPVTGEWRAISDFSENSVEAELRQDLNAAKLAWGLSFEAHSVDSDYRLAEIDSFREVRRLDAFIETTALADLKLRLSLYSLLDDTEERDRRFYAPDRNGVLVQRELSNFSPGIWWSLTMSGSF